MQIYYFWNEGKSTPMYSITVVTIKLFFIANYAEAYYKPEFKQVWYFWGEARSAPMYSTSADASRLLFSTDAEAQ
jgi:hypothetical protein